MHAPDTKLTGNNTGSGNGGAVSLALKGERFTKRLIDTGGTAKKDRLTHRIDIASLDEIDRTVESAIIRAYGLDS